RMGRRWNGPTFPTRVDAPCVGKGKAMSNRGARFAPQVEGRDDERSRSVSRGQSVHLRQNPLLQILVLHILCQSVEAVRVLDCVAADDLTDAALRLSGPVLLGEGGRRTGRGRRDFAPAFAAT